MAASSLSSLCTRSLFILPSQKLRCFCTQGDSHTIHVPVMLKECLSFLAPRDGQVSHEMFTAGYGRFTFNFVTIVFSFPSFFFHRVIFFQPEREILPCSFKINCSVKDSHMVYIFVARQQNILKIMAELKLHITMCDCLRHKRMYKNKILVTYKSDSATVSLLISQHKSERKGCGNFANFFMRLYAARL